MTAYDVGCGTGIFSFCLAERGVAVTGLDGSAGMLDQCRARLAAHPDLPITLRQMQLPADVTGWPRADLLISSSVFEYLPDLDAALGMVARLLKPEGTLILSLPNAHSYYRLYERALYRLTGHPRYLRLVHHIISPVEAIARIERHGFQHLETRYYATHLRLVGDSRRFLSEERAGKLYALVFRATP